MNAVRPDYEIKVDGVWYYCYGTPRRFTEWHGGKNIEFDGVEIISEETGMAIDGDLFERVTDKIYQEIK